MNKGLYFVMELLQSFDKKELKDLQSLANCNYFNSERKVISLLSILIQKVKQEEQLNAATLIAIYNELYNTKLSVLNNRHLNNLYSKMSLLHTLVHQFLMLEGLQHSEKTKAYLLQNQLLKRKQYRSYEKFAKVQHKLLEKMEQDVEFYEHQFIIEQGKLTYTQLTGGKREQRNINLIKESSSFYYLFNQLDAYLMDLILSESSMAHQLYSTFFNAIQPLLQISIIQSHPLVKVYLSVIYLLQKKTEEAFFMLVKDLEEYASKIPADSLVNFFNSAINFCVLQLRKGKPAYNRHLFDLYKTMDEKDLLFSEYQIHLSHLLNVITQSCRLEEFDWATEMLNKYEGLIPQHIREAVKDFYLGVIAYFKGDYQLAIDYLFPLPPINLSHDINRRTTIMKAYYELDNNYLETTQTLFRSFEKYIREHKSLTGKSKTSYKNFIRTLINLHRIKHKVTKMKLENVKQKLEAQKLNSNKSWLLEKMEELSN